MRTDDTITMNTIAAARKPQTKTAHFWLMLVQQALLACVAIGLITSTQANAVVSGLEALVGAAFILGPVVYDLAAKWRGPSSQWDNTKRVAEQLKPLPDRGPWPYPGFDLKGNRLPAVIDPNAGPPGVKVDG